MKSNAVAGSVRIPGAGPGHPSRRTSTLTLKRESFGFSSAHFTVFSASERENLHGHNFAVEAVLEVAVGQDGISFDYRIAKVAIEGICQRFNQRLLLPGESPHLTIDETDAGVKVAFAEERMFFLRRDILVLPVRNVTLEELSRHILDRFLAEAGDVIRSSLRAATFKVYSGEGQSASAGWRAETSVERP